MGIRLGKNAKITIGASKVGRMNSFSLAMGGQTVNTDSFGDNFEKKAMVLQGWTGSAEGFWDDDDTHQASLHSHAISGAGIPNIRFYVDDSIYYAPNVSGSGGDAEATCYITSFDTSADKAGVVNFSMGFEFSGPVRKV